MNYIKRFTPMITMLALCDVASAHDFWLSPQTYHPKANTITETAVMIGHPEESLTWPVTPHRVISFRSVGPDGITDHQSSVTEYSTTQSLPVKFEQSGVHILTIETTHAFSELESEKFNDYVEEEGLTPIKIDRALKGTHADPGREIYSRRGKSIIHVGRIKNANPKYLSKPIGLTLEIVPMENPSSVKAGEDITSQVLYRGTPIKGATIGLIDLSGSWGLIDTQMTNANGLVTFSRPKSGQWMQHAVWSDPMEDTREAEYDTIFSSLSFSVE